MITKRLMIILLIWLGVMPLYAQAAPDYAIRPLTPTYSNDGTELTITIEVRNNGGDAAVDATINVIKADSGRIIAEDTIPPLASGAAATASFTFRIGNDPFIPGSVQQIRVEVGIDEVEPLNGPNIQNNTTVFPITVPLVDTSAPQNPQNVLPPIENPTGAGEDVGSGVITIPIVDLTIDLNNPIQLLVSAGLLIITAVASILVLWLVSIIVRLIISRPPSFGNVLPPYAAMPPLDPNTIAGRRQQWQYYAQNSSILIPCDVPGSVQAIKVLQDIEGNPLGNWRVVAIRLSHYDVYGRIKRTESLGPKRAIRRLNRALQQRPNSGTQEISKKLRPVARALVKQLRKHEDKRTMILPIALDIHFQGKHGDVRIAFELYRCENGSWYRIDEWEPEIPVIEHTIHEIYTYTVHGKLGGETPKTFFKRLEEDILWLLMEMSQAHMTSAQPQPDTITGDTVTGMKAVNPDGDMPATQSPATP